MDHLLGWDYRGDAVESTELSLRLRSFEDIVTASASVLPQPHNTTSIPNSSSKKRSSTELSVSLLTNEELMVFVGSVDHFSTSQISAIQTELDRHQFHTDLIKLTENTTVEDFLVSVAQHSKRDIILQIILERIKEDTLHSQRALHKFFLLAKQSGFENVTARFSTLEEANNKALERHAYMYKRLICRFLAKYPCDSFPFIFILLQHIFDNYKRTFMEQFVRILHLEEPSLLRLIGIINNTVWLRFQTAMSLVDKTKKFHKHKHMVFGDIAKILDLYFKQLKNKSPNSWPTVHALDAKALYSAGLWVHTDYGLLRPLPDGVKQIPYSKFGQWDDDNNTSTLLSIQPSLSAGPAEDLVSRNSRSSVKIGLRSVGGSPLYSNSSMFGDTRPSNPISRSEPKISNKRSAPSLSTSDLPLSKRRLLSTNEETKCICTNQIRAEEFASIGDTGSDSVTTKYILEIDEQNESLCDEHKSQLFRWLGIAPNIVSSQSIFIVARVAKCVAKGLAK